MDDLNKNIINYEELIVKSLCDEINQEELSLLNAWIKESEDNNKIFESYKKSFHLSVESDTHSKIDINNEWTKFRNNIYKEQVTISKKDPFSIIYKIAAAIVVIAVISSVLYISFKPNEKIIIAENNKIEQKLDDGSIVSINKNSELTIYEDFNQLNRKIKLKGEAFFKVAKDFQKPFIVEAGQLSIKVIGTEFYVNYIESSGEVEVIVSSGKVAVYETDNPEAVTYLEKGQKTIYQTNNLSNKIDTVYNYNHISWETMQFEFNNESLNNVVFYLNKAYNANINFKNQNLKNCQITVSFDNQDIESVLNVLKNTLNLEIEKKQNQILISGEAC